MTIESCITFNSEPGKKKWLFKAKPPADCISSQEIVDAAIEALADYLIPEWEKELRAGGLRRLVEADRKRYKLPVAFGVMETRKLIRVLPQSPEERNQSGPSYLFVHQCVKKSHRTVPMWAALCLVAAAPKMSVSVKTTETRFVTIDGKQTRQEYEAEVFRILSATLATRPFAGRTKRACFLDLTLERRGLHEGDLSMTPFIHLSDERYVAALCGMGGARYYHDWLVRVESR